MGYLKIICSFKSCWENLSVEFPKHLKNNLYFGYKVLQDY